MSIKTINIQGTTLTYSDTDVITFAEGLIGMPQLRQMVLIHQTAIAPFLWLVSLDDPDTAFIVADPGQIYEGYEMPLPESVAEMFTLAEGATLLTLAIVSIAADWTKSTINLRAPILISPTTMQGAQIILTESACRHNEPLPLACAA